jgi:SAM-dependent methyltransferase
MARAVARGLNRSSMKWRLKILAKLVLSRLSIDYAWFRWLGIFRHGAMDEGDYVLQTFRPHLVRALEHGLKPGFTALEIGPGDSLGSAILTRGAGAAHVWLIDSGPYASLDIDVYRRIAEQARAAGVCIPDSLDLSNVAGMLSSCNAQYLTGGLRDWLRIPDSSVDWIWSQAVLEHIRLADFGPLCAEMRRVLTPGGIACHRIDLKDHLDGSLNNLRFGDSVWESDFMATSGFYTNRLRRSQILAAFAAAGLDAEVVGCESWPKLPVARRALAPRFRDMPDDELRVSGFTVVLRRSAHANAGRAT